MSWVDKTNDSFVIITGDGKRYAPRWMNPSIEKEFNVADFEFIGVRGTYVNRKKQKGRRLTFEIYFQGANHLDTAAAFNESANDEKAWKVNHPYYGRLLVHPIKITQENSSYNVSKLIIPVIETIDEGAPKVTVDPVNKIKELAGVSLGALQVSFGISQPAVFDIPGLQSDLTKVYEEGKKRVKTTIDASAYFNAFTSAYNAINNVVSEPLELIRLMQTVITAPAAFIDSVVNRVDMFIAQFEQLETSLENLDTVFDRVRYEQFSGAIISGMCEASVTNMSYSNRGQVIFIMDKIADTYDSYIENLDSLQSDNGGNPDSYVPDQAAIAEIDRMVNFTISNLIVIAISTKQERTVYLETDSNVIILAHRFYGLDQVDESINRIINDNQIGLNELIQIKKGRAISYTA